MGGNWLLVHLSAPRYSVLGRVRSLNPRSLARQLFLTSSRSSYRVHPQTTEFAVGIGTLALINAGLVTTRRS